MCGRFVLTLPSYAMAQLFNASPANDLPEVPRFNVCPTTQVHVIRAEGDDRRLVSMRWGFIPAWYKKPAGGPLLINARAETVAEKPAFRNAVRERRCLTPATGFYEWTKDEDGNKLPWYIHRSDGAPIVFAAVWQTWGGDDPVDTCTTLTTAATGTMTDIHHRVPVILEPDDWPLWLGEEGKGAATLMQAPDEGVLTWHRVDPAVNSNRAQGPELIEPI